jgi:hypothetical protein
MGCCGIGDFGFGQAIFCCNGASQMAVTIVTSIWRWIAGSQTLFHYGSYLIFTVSRQD